MSNRLRRLHAPLLAAALVSAALASAACSSDDGTGPGGGGDGGGGSVPAEVAGDWKWGTISMLNFWDDHTGEYVGTAGGVAVFFSFEENGDYTMNVYALSRSYGCVQQTWTEVEGTADFGATTFETTPEQGRYKASDSCVEGNNFDRGMTSDELRDARKTFYWNWRTDEATGKTYLMIGESPDLQSSFEVAR